MQKICTFQSLVGAGGWCRKVVFPKLQPDLFVFQPHFLQDVLNNHNTQDLMTLVPLSLLRGSAQELGRQILQQQPTARVQLLGNQGFIPTILGALSGLGPPREPQLHFQPHRNFGWLGTTMVGEPGTLARMLKAGGRRFASAKNKAEGSECLAGSWGPLQGLSLSGKVLGLRRTEGPQKVATWARPRDSSGHPHSLGSFLAPVCPVRRKQC